MEPVMILWMAGVLFLGIVCGWFGCAHTAELLNLTEQQYMDVVKEIIIAHGSDRVMREALVEELNGYRKDIYLNAEQLTNELQLMLERAGL